MHISTFVRFFQIICKVVILTVLPPEVFKTSCLQPEQNLTLFDFLNFINLVGISSVCFYVCISHSGFLLSVILMSFMLCSIVLFLFIYRCSLDTLNTNLSIISTKKNLISFFPLGSFHCSRTLSRWRLLWVPTPTGRAGRMQAFPFCVRCVLEKTYISQ